LRCARVAELGPTKIDRQMTAGLFIRVLCDAGKLRCASISLRTIKSGLNTIQEVAFIERLGQIADDPSLKGAGSNIIARIGRYHYGGNLFAQSRQIVVQIKTTHPGHVEVDHQAAGATQFG
jgi:hypothetical protein